MGHIPKKLHQFSTIVFDILCGQTDAQADSQTDAEKYLQHSWRAANNNYYCYYRTDGTTAAAEPRGVVMSDVKCVRVTAWH